MTGTADNNQPDVAALQAKLSQLETEVSKQKDLAQNWMGKYTDVEKRLNGKPLETIIEAAKERDILVQQSIGSDPKKLEAELDRKAKEVRDQFAPQLQERDSKIQQLSSRLKEQLVVNNVLGEAASSLYEKATDDFKEYVRRFCDLDDSEKIVVKDDKGNIRYSKANAAIPMSPKEFIEELKQSKDHWFKNPTPQGHQQKGERFVNPTGTVTFADIAKLPAQQQREVLAKLPIEDRRRIASEMNGKV